MYLLAELECDIQVYVLFFGDSADGAGVVSAVSGVDNDYKILRPDIAATKRRNEQSQAKAYILDMLSVSFHIKISLQR